MGSPSSRSTRGSTKTSFIAQMFGKWGLILILLASLEVRKADDVLKSNKGLNQDKNLTNKSKANNFPSTRSERSANSLQEFWQNSEKEVIYIPLQNGNSLLNIEGFIAPSTTAPEQDDDNTQKNKFSFHPGVPASEYMLPYPRPGRSNGPGDTKYHGHTEGNKNELKRFVRDLIPFPRFGRSKTKLDQIAPSESLLPHMRFGRQANEYLLPYMRAGRRGQDTSEESAYMTPYPRIGKKSSDTLLPYLRFGRAKNPEMSFLLQTLDAKKKSSDSLLPYMRFGRKTEEFPGGLFITPSLRMGKRSDESIAPQLRFGRDESSEFITPYPRIGKRSDGLLLPYMRFGRRASDEPEDGINEFLTPYPRMGKKSDASMLPSMRFGRGSVDETDSSLPASEFMTPYPRIGKRVEGSLLPYMRFGRNNDDRKPKTESDYDDDGIYDFITPYPRIGKKSEGSLLPYMRFGRQVYDNMSPGSEYMTPYPRIGKKSDGTLLPYLRFGKRGGEYLTPYPRLGKKSQESILPYMRYGKRYNEYLTPYPRLGKKTVNLPSTHFKSIVTNSDAGKHHENLSSTPGLLNRLSQNAGDELARNGKHRSQTNEKDTTRTGRSESTGEEELEEEEELDLDSSSNSNSTESEEQQTLIPYPRFGRVPEADVPSKMRLINGNPMSIQQMMKGSGQSDEAIGNLNYILPYPRPGRSVYLNSRQGQTSNDFNERQPSLSGADNQIEVSNYMLPYLRPGRSNTAM